LTLSRHGLASLFPEMQTLVLLAFAAKAALGQTEKRNLESGLALQPLLKIDPLVRENVQGPTH
jgi:hypothetical protein